MLTQEYAGVRNKFCNDLSAKYKEFDAQLCKVVDSEVDRLLSDKKQFSELKQSIESRIDRNVDRYVDTKFKNLENEIDRLKKNQRDSNLFWGCTLAVSVLFCCCK